MIVCENHYLTFPRTPFEVHYHEDPAYGDSGKRYHLFVGGEWESWESTLKEVDERLAELKSKYSNDWHDSESRKRFRPDWENWYAIDRWYEDMRNKGDSHRRNRN